MTFFRSFRLRLLVGTILWTAGLLAVAHAISIAYMRHFRTHILHIGPGVIFGAVLLMAAGISQVRVGLSPIVQLRARLKALREGRESRIEGRYPTEVQPLVNDLNALLEHRAAVVRRALAKAGDLAHGLKTPLAVLWQEAERAEAAGQTELAATIGQQVERMRRQVDYHLAHARAAASGATPGATCAILPSAEGLTRTLLRLHADRGLAIEIDVSADHLFRGEKEDLEEMLGNLLDNACKWAASRVVIQSSRDDGHVVITIDDDGSGLDPAMWDSALQRGVRADEAAPGSGFGLAIVREIAELYGGSISLSRSPMGGLRASLELPG